MTHIEILEAIAQCYGQPRYLEIGLGDAGCFQRIARHCSLAVGVDVPSNPYGDVQERVQRAGGFYFGRGSDQFFQVFDPAREVFDLIFVDGDHHAEQVWRDWENSLRLLAPLGTIALHDTWANTREEAESGSDTAYQVAERIEMNMRFDCYTLPIRPGLTLARPRVKRFSAW